MTASVSPREDPHLTTRRVTTLSVAVAVILITMKAFALGASGSVSVLASLADSSLDLIASLGAFWAVRWAASPPDEEHRYGHAKGEALSALVQAGLVFASAVFIGWEAIRRILDPQPITGGALGVSVIVVSIILTVGLVILQTRAVKATGSMAVSGDRMHYLSDLGANVAVLIGLVSGAYLNAPGLDAAAGLVVAVWLFWGAQGVLRTAADTLLDRAAPPADRLAVTKAVLADPRIGGVHRLRTRLTGGGASMIQMHVDLDPALTLAQAHAIVVEAERRVQEALPGADVLIHADPRGQDRDEGDGPGHGPASGASGPWS